MPENAVYGTARIGIGDPASGRTYYHNTHTGTTTWDRPAVAAGSSAASVALKVVFLPDSPGEDPRYLFPSLTDAFPAASFVFPATAEEAAAWAARIPKQVRPPPPGQQSPQEGVDKTVNVAGSTAE